MRFRKFPKDKIQKKKMQYYAVAQRIQGISMKYLLLVFSPLNVIGCRGKPGVSLWRREQIEFPNGQ